MTDPDRWKTINDIVNDVVECPDAERSARLSARCAGDSSLRRDVEALLDAHGRAGSFLHVPAVALMTTAHERSDAALVGRAVGAYQIVGVIGRGGMGVVYRARDSRLGRDVALKFVPTARAGDAAALQRLIAEARAASSLNHPNICTIHDIGEQDGHPFIVMELLEGRTLRELLASGPIDGSRVVALALEIADALSAADRKGLIHRDLKPANIFVTDSGHAKVLDFGLAKTASPDPGGPRTMPGATPGTIGYMSPEQARGEPLDPRSDLFAFGAVLYEMATGSAAYAGSDAVASDGVLNRTPVPMRSLNPSVSPGLEGIVSKAMQKDRDRRYPDAAAMHADLAALATVSTAGTGKPALGSGRRLPWPVLAAALTGVVAVVAVLAWRQRPVTVSLERARVVVADIQNHTDERVFDVALKQALLAGLDQSPFLDIAVEQDVRGTLRLMGQSPDDPLTAERAREVCVRQGLQAALVGSIAALGGHYAISLEATRCRSGETLARAEAEAANKEDVLRALGDATKDIRRRLGESLASVRRFDAPLAKATTRSLDALEAYGLGAAEIDRGSQSEAIPFFDRAIAIDPDFALAYLREVAVYSNSGETTLARRYAKAAFERRDRVSERERYYIDAYYYDSVTGELDKREDVCRLWTKSYPGDTTAWIAVVNTLIRLGHFDEAYDAAQIVARLAPRHATSLLDLAGTQFMLSRFDEATRTLDAAESAHLDLYFYHLVRLTIGWWRHDPAAVARQSRWADGKPAEYEMRRYEAVLAAAEGRIKEARRLYEASGIAAARVHRGQSAANARTGLALVEALVGNRDRAVRLARDAWPETDSAESKMNAALALALAGDTKNARARADELARTFPLDTLVSRAALPAIDAALALAQGDVERAVSALRPAESMGLAAPDAIGLRGMAYLKLGRGGDAEREFRRILDHGPMLTTLLWAPKPYLSPLAQLGVARALALQGQIGRSRAAYAEFLAAWENGDPDVPLLREARSEVQALSGAARD